MQRVPEVSRLFRWLAVTAGCTVTVTGCGVLWAWSFPAADVPDWGSTAGPPRPETWAGLALGGLSLMLLARSPGATRRRVGHLLGALTAVIGLLAALDQFDVRATELLRLRPLLGPAAQAAPGLHPATAAALLLIGLALVALDLPPLRHAIWSQALALATTAISLVPLLAYLVEVGKARSDLESLVAIPPPSAVGMLILSAGVVLARPGEGLLRPFSSLGPGGILSRRLTPVFAAVPLGVALLAGVMIRLGNGPPGFAIALSSALFLLIAMLVLNGTVSIVDEAAAKRDSLVAELAAERDFTATLLHSLSEAVVVFDRDLRVIDANPRACELFGRPVERLVGQAPPYSWQPDGESAPPPLGTPTSGHADDGADDDADGGTDDRTNGTGDRAGEAHARTVRRDDGTLVPVLAWLSPVLDDEHTPRAYVGTFVDMTGHRRAENTLAERAGQLAEANERLRLSNQRLSDAAEFKRDLMSLVSHEVSQPLSSVASLSELLSSDWAELPDDIRLELTQKIDKNARRLTGLIHDMVLLFRLDAGTVSARREPVPVIEVVEAVADAAPETAQVEVSGDPELYALVDRGHLRQMLTNLVNNAMAHGEPPIEISTERDSAGVVVSVRDHGPGIPEERLPHLFDRVLPTGGGGRRSRGSGLGLFIVRHLVEVNGGTIWYEKVEPRGARLALRLEEAAAHAVAGAPGSRAVTPG